MNQIQKLTQAIRNCAECELDYGTLRTLKMIDDESIRMEKAVVAKPQLCDSLPDDKEIEFVASDESNGVDVDDLKSRPIWADGFIEGAKWMRSRIK